MHAPTIDCQNLTLQQTGLSILSAYNGAKNGSEFIALVDSMDANLRIWLIEAGVRHRFQALPAGGFRLTLRRGLSPGQGTVPGLHHVVMGRSGNIWACERGQRLIRADAYTGAITAVAEIAKKASHLAIEPAGKYVFVADSGANALLAISSEDLSVQHVWEAPGGPQLPLVTAAGIVCVTGGGSGTLTIVRPGQRAYQSQTIVVGACPHDPIASPAGKHVFVPCAGDAVIVRVDLENGRVLARYPTGAGPSHIALHPDADRLYCANTFDGTLTCMSVEGDLLAQQASGGWAHQPAVSADGRFVYVANFLDDSIAVFETASMEKIASLETEAYPHGLEVSPDGRWLIATGFSSDKLRVYATCNHAEVARIEVGRGSSHIAFVPDHQSAYVACSVDDHLARINLRDMTCSQRLRVA